MSSPRISYVHRLKTADPAIIAGIARSRFVQEVIGEDAQVYGEPLTETSSMLHAQERIVV